MTKDNLITAPEGTTLEEAQKILGKHRIEKLPIVDKDFNLKGLITIKDIEKTIQYPHSAKDKNGRLLVGAAVGVGANYLDRVKALIDAKVDIVAVDTAHGHSTAVLEAVRKIKKTFPDLPVIAAMWPPPKPQGFNQGRRRCSESGHGAGSICTTRVIAGIGGAPNHRHYGLRRKADKYGVKVMAMAALNSPAIS